jgi:hypothetical protein
MKRFGMAVALLLLAAHVPALAQDSARTGQGRPPRPPERNSWGLDIMASDGGFGAGVFFRREIDPDLSWFVTFSISESKDKREVDRIDPWTGLTYTPGKLSRFLVLPLYGGLQWRLFREDIEDNFRPFVNAAVGPTMIYAMPYQRVSPGPGGFANGEQVDFFKAIGQGQAHYTFGGYLGFGANFGTTEGSVFGVNFRYYIINLFGEGLPSAYNVYTGETAGTKTDFGGVALTVSFGSTF